MRLGFTGLTGLAPAEGLHPGDHFLVTFTTLWVVSQGGWKKSHNHAREQGGPSRPWATSIMTSSGVWMFQLHTLAGVHVCACVHACTHTHTHTLKQEAAGTG